MKYSYSIKNIISDINANVFTLSAVVIGFALTDNNTPAVQNSLGNWFMLIGQILATNASQQQVINNGNNKSNSTNTHIVNDNNLNYDNLQNVISTMQDEINKLKKTSNI